MLQQSFKNKTKQECLMLLQQEWEYVGYKAKHCTVPEAAPLDPVDLKSTLGHLLPIWAKELLKLPIDPLLGAALIILHLFCGQISFPTEMMAVQLKM